METELYLYPPPQTSASSNVENLPPQVVRRLSKEVRTLARGEAPEGIKVLVNEEDITDVQAAIEGPGEGVWGGGGVKFGQNALLRGVHRFRPDSDF